MRTFRSKIFNVTYVLNRQSRPKKKKVGHPVGHSNFSEKFLPGSIKNKKKTSFKKKKVGKVGKKKIGPTLAVVYPSQNLNFFILIGKTKFQIGFTIQKINCMKNGNINAELSSKMGRKAAENPNNCHSNSL